MTKQKLLSALLVIAMLAAIPFATFAQEAEAVNLEVAGQYDEEVSGEESNDELFSEYVMQQFYGEGIALYSTNYGEEILPDEVNIAAYRVLKEKIKNIAENGGSAVITVTKEELGLDSIITDVVGGNVNAALSNLMRETLNFNLLFKSLLIDCPYELYWFDKIAGWRYSPMAYSNGREVWIDSFEFSFQVAEGYQANNYNSDAPAVKSNVSSVAAAVAEAKKVVADNAEKTDLAKLVAYKDYICKAVSYNNTAVNTPNYPYGDPWQLIYVFDRKASTDVVCEGYAKAFQYLCELSDFGDDTFASYLVTGQMAGGTGEGGHMWNVVTFDGCNYIVDVTNSDKGTIGQDGELFMACEPYRDLGDDGYVFRISGDNISFVYDSDTKAMYDGDALELGQNESLQKVTISGIDETLGEATLTLKKDGAIIGSAVSVNGGYKFHTAQTSGSFVLEVSKENYTTREYEVTISNGTATLQNIELWKKGDLTGEGEANSIDISKLYAHVSGSTTGTANEMVDYALKCADVTDDGNVNAIDISRLYAHVSGQQSLWSE